MKEEDHGTARERHVREIAARLGVADFVYTAPPVSKGAAFREASGDGLLIVGNRGAVLQVKSRAPDARTNDNEARVEAWTRKNAKKAVAQGEGTKREITRRARSGIPLAVSPVRVAHLPTEQRVKYDRTITTDVTDWPTIVLIDHPAAVGLDLGFLPGVVWFTIEDWNELHRRLRSVSATLTYIERVLTGEIHVPLGHESIRYRVLREADEQFIAGGPTSTVPYLTHPEHFDELGADLFHDILDKVWHDDGIIPWRHADDYRRIVEFMDGVAPVIQAKVGRWFLQKRSEIAQGRRRASGIVVLDRVDKLVYICSHARNWPNDGDWLSEVMSLAMLRHEQAFLSGAPNTSITLVIGALVEDRPPKTGVAYTFALLDGKEALVKLPPTLKRMKEYTYGIFEHRDGRVRELQVNRKDPCPCGSGKKFKRCCGN